MIVGMKRVVIELEYRGIVPVEDAVGTRIDCLCGRIWITQHGCADDTVLEAGESYEISRPGRAVVQALRGARVALHAPPAAAGLAARLEQRWRRLAGPALAARAAIARSGAD